MMGKEKEPEQEKIWDSVGGKIKLSFMVFREGVAPDQTKEKKDDQEGMGSRKKFQDQLIKGYKDSHFVSISGA